MKNLLLLKIETARIDSLLGGILAHANKLMVTRIENLNISTGRKILYGVMMTGIENLNISTGQENTLVENQFTATSTEAG